MFWRIKYRASGALCALLIAAMPSAAFSQSVPGRCVRFCNVPTGPSNSSTLAVNYRGFLDVVSGFEGLVFADSFRAMAAPSSIEEYDRRVAEFYEAAHREQDYLNQRIAKTRADEGVVRTLLATLRNDTEHYREQIPDLEREAEPIRQRAQALQKERRRWESLFDRVESAQSEWHYRAYRAQNDVIELLQVVAPPKLLRLTDTRVRNSSEKLWPLAVSASGMAAAPAAVRASSATAARAWAPSNRPLPIDPNLSSSAKVENLRNLAVEMRNAHRTFEVARADLEVLEQRAGASRSAWQEAKSKVQDLKGDIEYYSKEAETSGRKILTMKANFPLFRDEMTLSALQAWAWTYERDKIVIPAVKRFLINNGLKPIAGRLGAGAAIATLKMRNDITWEKVTNIRGINEFMSVQEKVLALLNPTTSNILQSAQFNAALTWQEAAAFSSELDAQLGDDSQEIMERAGANLPPPYKRLFARLMRR